MINKFLVLLLALMAATFFSCKDDKKDGATVSDPMEQSSDTVKTVATPDTDTIETEMQRPVESIIETRLDTTLLFQTWTLDPDVPHADFVLSAKSFYVVDYDGDGDMVYALKQDHLTVFYDDYVQKGEIMSLTKDTLKIKWGAADTATYTKWKN